uniref:Uncharacterized protein n=1 Tax=Dromaius novaehollandiae TaxID=8790 RepID=A0A8C4J5I8_DRONO
LAGEAFLFTLCSDVSSKSAGLCFSLFFSFSLPLFPSPSLSHTHTDTHTILRKYLLCHVKNSICPPHSSKWLHAWCFTVVCQDSF